MKMKIGITEERRFALDMSPISEAITRAMERLFEKCERTKRKARSLLEIIDDILYGSVSLGGTGHRRSLWDVSRTLVYGLAHWLGFIFLDLRASVVDYKTRVAIYSERVHVRLLLLAERAQVFAGAFRAAMPRRQDRDSGDADAHNDNKKGKEAFTAVAASRATHRLSLQEEHSYA